MFKSKFSKLFFYAFLGFAFGFALNLFVISFANAYEVPANAVIKVFDANGKQIGEMSRSKYKVVKIEDDVKVIKQRMVEKKYRAKHNSVILHASRGYTGKLDVDNSGSNYNVEQKKGPVGGVTLCHTKNGAGGICGSAFTNKSAFIGLKKDF